MSLSEAGILEFSLWDAGTNTRSHTGLLKMRYLETNYGYFHDNEWRPVCYTYPYISEEYFGQMICESMDFHSSHSSSMSQSVEGLYDPGEVEGYPVYCYEQGEPPHDCIQMNHQKYCYIEEGYHGGEEYYGGEDLPSYFFWIDCLCREGFQRTNFGCKHNVKTPNKRIHTYRTID